MPSFHDILTNPSCSEFLGLSPPVDFPDDASVYEIDDEFKSTGSIHGATRSVRCVSGYEPSLLGTRNVPQFLVCDRGRWVTADPTEQKLVCRKPCAPYESVDSEFNPNEMAVVANGGLVDGSTRLLSCLAGFHAVEGSISPEELKCHNGVWDRRTLSCTEGEGLSQALRDAVCGSLELANLMRPNHVYVLKQILSTSVEPSSLLSQPQPAAPSAGAATQRYPNTQMVLWSLRCSRGYKAANGKINRKLVIHRIYFRF